MSDPSGLDPTTDIVAAASRGDVTSVNNALTALKITGVDTTPYEAYVHFAEANKAINDDKAGAAPSGKYAAISSVGTAYIGPEKPIAPGVCTDRGDGPDIESQSSLPYVPEGFFKRMFNRAAAQHENRENDWQTRSEGGIGAALLAPLAWLEDKIRGVSNVPHNAQSAVRKFGKGDIAGGVADSLEVVDGVTTAVGIAKVGVAGAMSVAESVGGGGSRSGPSKGGAGGGPSGPPEAAGGGGGSASGGARQPKFNLLDPTKVKAPAPTRQTRRFSGTWEDADDQVRSLDHARRNGPVDIETDAKSMRRADRMMQDATRPSRREDVLHTVEPEGGTTTFFDVLRHFINWR